MKPLNILIFLINIVYVLADTGTVYKVNVNSSLNIRKSASTTSESVGSLKNGQFIYATSVSNEWAKFYKGYVSTKYLIKTTSGTNYITIANVNFRSGPSINYDIITTENTGTEIIYFDNDPFNTDWSITNFGYINSEYISLKDNKQEYDFAVGLIEIEAVKEILDGKKDKWWNILMDWIEENNEYLLAFSKEDRKLFANITWNELHENNKFKTLINDMNFKHAGFYLGINGEGELFEFDLDGIHNNSYTFDKSYLKKDKNDKIGWNWYKLNISGKTYVSPDNLYKSLKEYESKNNYFIKGSYHPWCNNCQDFVKWCLEIISNNEDEERLVPGYTIDIVKNNYMYLTDPDQYKGAVETFNELLSICKKKFKKTKSLIKDLYLDGVFNKIFNSLFFSFGEFGQKCSVMDMVKFLESDYNKTCQYYDYSGILNFKQKLLDNINDFTYEYNDVNIAANDDFNYDFISENNLCYKFDETTNTNTDTINDKSTNNRCGPNYGKCPSGQCCNKNGKCGTKATFCSKQNGCQPKYGKCKNIRIVTKKKVVKKVVTKVVTKKKNNH